MKEKVEKNEEKEYDLNVTLNIQVMAESHEKAVDWLRFQIYHNTQNYDFDIE